MFNIVVGKVLMVHADKCEYQDDPLMEQTSHKDIKIEYLWVNDIMMTIKDFS